ncbi:MAG: CPBP family intramembrane metalloprotease [Flavobacteriia bacterium]|nr:CPBP family intramembrane metalloprotease [Flavobacteriia bacterium]OIP45469.1 MAG: hypothetical protein AUK46_11500 [Flavobacteriaceae bacterium CG2_30_31_66]PIV97632.1 MAG: CPBP family intramembrane metalloprotease [Flavobacteriaceae bacterium CG17_big_fil_post_rev_8_21_14_2_50_31_13]PIX11552.1 MAG: CPBP family intramembrane metalloprotease [Flavobacteriaceae bacterium CG_4_8_14_3_um_filter_31_8]PIY14899.1 MAG: CPBP family intramembrane metalloprotease [Flavobacteriaceae bacterium CG_4_10_
MNDFDSEIKGYNRVIILIVAYFSFIGVFQLVGLVASGVRNESDLYLLATKQHLIVGIANLIGHLLLLWFFMKVIDKEPFVNIGLHFKNRIFDLISGILIGALIMVFGYFVLKYYDGIYSPQINFDLYEIIYAFFIFTIVAITEEFLMRGYILRNLMNSFNKYTSLAISSILFSLFHFANPYMDLFTFFDLFLAGILLGITYIYTKNLWFPIALHFSWNFFQSLFGFNVSGQDFYSIIDFEIKENNIFNIGDFGFEGSVFSIIIQIMLIIAIVIYYEKKQLKKSISKTSLPANSFQ